MIRRILLSLSLGLVASVAPLTRAIDVVLVDATATRFAVDLFWGEIETTSVASFSNPLGSLHVNEAGLALGLGPGSNLVAGEVLYSEDLFFGGGSRLASGLVPTIFEGTGMFNHHASIFPFDGPVPGPGLTFGATPFGARLVWGEPFPVESSGEGGGGGAVPEGSTWWTIAASVLVTAGLARRRSLARR